MEKIIKLVQFRQQVSMGLDMALGIPYAVPCYTVDFNEYGTVTCDGKIVGRDISRITVRVVPAEVAE